MSLEHLAILLIAGLFILGPEKLPQAAAWAGRTLREVRAYATDTQQRFRAELGDDFRQVQEPLEQLREPLQQLNALRGIDPRRAVVNYLLDDRQAAAPNEPATKSAPRPRELLRPGERPPFDADAT
ncbi:sec-independent protein translocase protein TatB [Saccharopolyspora phatthalungensis]|uniref:Sec-independent protein translocase protein TatB n=1 Tax=Saccharopolyspora phatthalungensis TaxID=664693 RepID=A0A840QK31_9PSEU|nr:sec-independent protein translocase protein TatB [Saccharopolyspora phatthalungensis]